MAPELTMSLNLKYIKIRMWYLKKIDVTYVNYLIRIFKVHVLVLFFKIYLCFLL